GAKAWIEVNRFRDERREGEIVFAGIDSFGGFNPYLVEDVVTESLERHFFNHVAGRGDAVDGEPGVLESWKVSEVARFFFVSERHAQEAAQKVRAVEDRWPEWGLLELAAEGDEVRVGFKDGAQHAVDEVQALFDGGALLPVRRLRVQLLQAARESLADFRQSALEAGQIRGAIAAGDSSYDLLLAGETENFMREFKAYYDSNKALGASYRLAENLPCIREPEVLLTLRPGLLWHDGVAVSAQDLEFSFEFCAEQRWNAALAEAMGPVQSVTALDERVARVVYRELPADPLALWSLVVLLPRHLLEGRDEAACDDHFSRLPVGTGPLRVAERPSGGGLVLEGNQDYFLGAPTAERLVFLRVPSRIGRRMRLLMDQVDCYGLEEGEAEMAVRGDARFEAFASPGGWQSVLLWNPGRKLAGDQRVRRALTRAIDVALLHGGGGEGDSCSGFFEGSSSLHDADSTAPAHDPEMARKLLAVSGWVADEAGALRRGGERLRLRLASPAGDKNAAGVLRAVAAQWGRLGASVELAEYGRGEGFFASDADVVFLRLPLARDWESFRYGPGARIALEYLGRSAAAGDLERRLIAATGEPEQAAVARALHSFIEDEQFVSFLTRERRYRVLRADAFSVSRAVGDGHRIDAEFGAGGEGIDATLPWWVPLRAGGAGPGQETAAEQPEGVF
ncbi:MAG: ABC transporter substrate-binding protein, partial [Verrucomicrobiales bacterium]